MTDLITNAEFRAALGSLQYNASNFQVFTFWIAGSFLLGFTIMAACFAALQSQPDMSVTSLTSYVIAIAVFLVIVGFAYTGYLRNIGRYVGGRIKPSFANSSDLIKCGRYSTGTTPNK